MEKHEIIKPICDTAVDYCEIAIDTIFTDETIKEIPVLKTIYSVFKTTKNVKDFLLLKRINAFINGCGNISEGKRSRFILKMGDEKFCTKVGEKILLLVDKVDEVEKAELIGKAFVLFIEDKIEIPFYFRLCSMIDRCFYDDLKTLYLFSDERTIITSKNELVETISLESLSAVGLLSTFGIDGGDFALKNSGIRYGLNSYSEILKSIL